MERRSGHVGSVLAYNTKGSNHCTIKKKLEKAFLSTAPSQHSKTVGNIRFITHE